MTLTQFVIMAVIAAVVTPVGVLLIPRARQSVAFDRLLWVATFVLAFLGAWLALGYANADTNGSGLTGLRIADVPVIASLIGAAGGVFILNLPLVVLDLFTHASEDEVINGGEADDELLNTPSPNGNGQPKQEIQDVERGE